MRHTLLIIVAAWLMLTLLGWLVLGQFSCVKRNLLMPAAPVVGTAALVAALHYTTLIGSVQVGIWFVGLAAIILVILNFRKDRRWWVVSRSGVLLLLLTAALGAIPAAEALHPSVVVGDSRVVQVDNSNDAFYYVTVIDWVTHHRAEQRPVFRHTPEQGGDPLSYASAHLHAAAHLRVGDELVQAAINVVLHLPSVVTWYPLTALWILLLPAAGFGAARCLKMLPASGMIMGVVVASSAMTMFQLVNQNSDSLLGIAVVPFAIGAVLQGLGRSPIFGRGLAALMLAALLGTYAEFTPLVLPAFAVAVVARRRSEIPLALRSALAIVAISVVVAPLAWANAIRSLLYLGSIASDRMRSPFSGATSWEMLNRFIGTSTFGAGSGSNWFALTLAAALIVGMLAALILSARRVFLAALAATGGALAYYLAAIKHRPYSQLRTIELWLPLVLFVAVFGYDRTYQWWSTEHRSRTAGTRRADSPFSRLRVVALIVATAPGLIWVSVNQRTDNRLVSSSSAIKARHVDGAFAEAADWLRAAGGEKGRNTMVLSAQFFNQLWITEALRSQTETAYPFLYISYQSYPRYWDGRLTRWLLVDRSVMTDVDPAMVVHSNSRFILLDLKRGQAVLACNTSTSGRPNLFVLRTPGIGHRVRLVGYTKLDPAPPLKNGGGPGPVTGRGRGAGLLPRGMLHPDTTFIDVSLPATPDAQLVTSDGTSTFVVRKVSREPAS